MISPYPRELTVLAHAYWTAAGMDVAQVHSISDEFRACELTGADIAAAAALAPLNAGAPAPFLPGLKDTMRAIPALVADHAGARPTRT